MFEGCSGEFWGTSGGDVWGLFPGGIWEGLGRVVMINKQPND